MSILHERWKQEGKWEWERDRSVLIVVDMQNDWVAPGSGSQTKEATMMVPKIKQLIEKCRELGVPVIYTRQETDPAYNPLEVAAIPGLKNSKRLKGKQEYEIYHEIAPEPGEIVINKRRFSAFYGTDLDIVLANIRGKTNPVDTIIICGTIINVCCEALARDAFNRDFKVIMGSDICAALTEESREATLVNMRLLGMAMDCESIIKALENGKG